MPYICVGINHPAHMRLWALKTEIMTKQEIKLDLEQGTYMLNDNETWVLDFWEEAVKKCPELVEKEINDLNKSIKNDEDSDEMFDEGFHLNRTYKEMFKNLNIN